MNNNWCIIFFVINAILISNVNTLSDELFPKVNTSLGVIEGFYEISPKNHRYQAFEGIPYAEKPIGDLRFQPPVAVKPWTNNLNAKNKPSKCIQFYLMTVIGQEDCLYLNVYVPGPKNATSAFPVIVVIHGGGFRFGYSMYFRPTHIIDKNVIFVTINYRLGPFGFLSTGDKVVLGNMGLKDQSMALKWIKNNIEYFGGDKERITITGCSAGSSSVHYHYLSPMSAGLFRNGMSSSGCVLSPWAFDDNPLKQANKLAELLGCSANNSIELLRCLKKRTPEEICDASGKMSLSETLDLGINRVPFQPVAEKTDKEYFINRSPIEILESGDVYDVPWVVGSVSGEGVWFAKDFIKNQTILSYMDKNWEKIGPYLMHFSRFNISKIKYPVIANDIRQHYLGNKSFVDNEGSTKGLIDLISDVYVHLNVQRAIKLHAAAVKKSYVRFFYYDAKKQSNKLGIPHCADWFFILQNDNFNYTADENKTKILERFVDFVYTVATDENDNWKKNWEKVNPETEYVQYLHIQYNTTEYVENDDFARKKYWKKLIQQ